MSAPAASPSSFAPAAPPTSGPGAGAAIAIALIAGTAILGLFVAAITFFALALAFPIAVPIAEQFHVFVPPADLALAERLADFAWAFGALGIGSLVAAVFVAVKSIQLLSPTDRV
jgi:hypothetical protein